MVNFSSISEQIELMIRKLLYCLTFVMISCIAKSQVNTLVINDIRITGNKTTKVNIIVRELTFKKGDTLLIEKLEELINRSRENILNTSLFNFVTITESYITPDILDLIIKVEERWYTWPSFFFKYEDRNFSAWLKAKDLSKSKYGFSVERFNFRGRKENLKISVLFGYANQFEISYKNIALDRNRKHFIGGSVEFSSQDQVIVNTINNEPVNFKSRFHTVFERNKYTINYLYRPYINDLHNFFLNYVEYDIADTIIKLNQDYLVKNKDNMDCFTLDYVFSSDKRDSKAYPLRGSYFEILLGQTISLPFSGNSFTSTVIVPGYYRYIQLSNRLYYAGGINLKLSYSNYYSYLYSRALGYNYNMHGFEYNTIEGQHFVMIKNLFKIAVLKPRIAEIPFIPLHKFNKVHYALYFNLFTDCGYVSNKYKTADNSYTDKFLFSCGAGLDLVTYYDRTLRAEYSVNGFGVGGFYLSLTAPINK